MKKTLVLASLLAAFGAASAQSTVTLSGSTAFSFQKRIAINATTMQPEKGLAETDFTFKLAGSENLGGGLTAMFSMEMDNCGNVKGTITGASCDDTFRVGLARKNTSLSLAGSFGAVTLANTRGGETAVTYGMVGSANLDSDIWSGQVFSRGAIDALGYTSPRNGGVQWTVGTTESSTDGVTTPAARVHALGLNYAAGPLAAAVAYKYLANNLTAAKFRGGNFELGLNYDLGVAKVGFGYDSKPFGLSAPVNDKAAFVFGVNVPFGTSSVGVNYAKRGTAKVMEVGYQNNLSARTNVNFSVGQQTIGAAVTAGTAQGTRGQYRLSLNHAF